MEIVNIQLIGKKNNTICMLLRKYNKCIYCKSRDLKKEKNQYLKKNFYLEAIKSDLKISTNKLKQIKVYRCQKCKIIQNNPWFSESISRKIYSNIYGQHNRSWSNLINFLKKGITPNHGRLYEILNKKIKIKNYAEFNSPFMGLMLNFFRSEYKRNNFFYKSILMNTINYLSARQVAGKSQYYQKLSAEKAKKFLKQCENLKRVNLIKKKNNKYLFVDNSSLCWGQNDNYKSVNSKSFASELLDLQILDLNRKNENIKFDLFGILHTLDHTFEPSKILNFALNNSKYVIVYCHIDEKIQKQHLFSLNKEFLKFLNKKKIYTLDLTNRISKKFTSPELYFLCSKKKELINKIK